MLKEKVSAFVAVAIVVAAGFIPMQAAQSPQAKKEIEQLVNHLRQSSQCKFQRNGSWYSAAEAADHIMGKYDYLLQRGWADTAELFIERAATESSFSGKPYAVQCGSAPAEASAAWFNAYLKKLRAQ